MNSLLLTGASGCGKSWCIETLKTRFTPKYQVIRITDESLKNPLLSIPLMVESIQNEKEKESVVLIDDLDKLFPRLMPTREQLLGSALVADFLDNLANDVNSTIVIATATQKAAIHPCMFRSGAFCQRLFLGELQESGLEALLSKCFEGLEGDRKRVAIDAVRVAAAGKPVGEVLGLCQSRLHEEVYAKKHRDEGESKAPSPTGLEHQGSIGGDKLSTMIHNLVLKPLRNYEQFHQLGVSPPPGLLLFGPSGVGKTHALRQAAALAKEIATVVTVTCPDIISKVVGETEKALASIFREARRKAPSLVILDQLDAIAPKRSHESSGFVYDRMLSVLLTEIDGVTEGHDEVSSSNTTPPKPVIVLAAVRHPSLLDPAILRPGRLDWHTELELPNEEERRTLWGQCLKSTPHEAELTAETLAANHPARTPAAIFGEWREAVMACMKRDLESGVVRMSDFTHAIY